MTAIALVIAVSGCGSGDDERAASCPEIAPPGPGIDQWTSEGCAVATEVIHSHAGPEECGWELVDYLVIGPDTYHFDPVNFLSYVDGLPRNRTLPIDRIPENVIDTGLRRDDEALWRDPDDPQYAYVVDGKFADRYLLDTEGSIVCEG